MKIDRIYNLNIEKIYNNKKSSVEETKKTNNKDAIEISKAAKNLAAITNDNYIDGEKDLQKIKEKVDSGSYYINTKKLAEKFKEIMKGREA